MWSSGIATVYFKRSKNAKRRRAFVFGMDELQCGSLDSNMQTTCTHCKAQYDFPGLESLEKPLLIKCEKCDQVFEVNPARTASLDSLEGLDDALKELATTAVPLEPMGPGDEIPELERGGHSSVQIPIGSRKAFESNHPPPPPRITEAPQAASTEKLDERKIFLGDEEFHLDIDSNAVEKEIQKAPSTVPPQIEHPKEEPKKEKLPDVRPQKTLGSTPVPAPPPPIGSTPRKPDSSIPPPRTSVPPRHAERRKVTMGEDEKAGGSFDESLEEILNGAKDEAPPLPPPPPKAAKYQKKADKRPARKKAGFEFPPLSPQLFIMAGAVLIVVITIIVCLFMYFGEGTAAEQWAKAQSMQSIDPLTATRIFIAAAREPDDAILKSLYYGRQAPGISSGKVGIVGKEFDQQSLGVIAQVIKEKEQRLSDKKNDLTAKQLIQAKYQSLRTSGDPDDIRIYLDSQKRELGAVRTRMETEETEAASDLQRVTYDMDQITQKIKKAQSLVDKYSKPKTPLEEATYQTNLVNVQTYRQELESKKNEYAQMKSSVDAKVAEIEKRYVDQIRGFEDSIAEKTQDLSLLEVLKSDNPQPLLDLQKEIANLSDEVAALDKEDKSLKAEMDRAQQSLSRIPGIRNLISNGDINRSRVEVAASIKLEDGTAKSSIILARYLLKTSNKTVVGDWLVDELK